MRFTGSQAEAHWQATGVHDPLQARAAVLRHGGRKVALVSVDLVGFFYPNVVNVRDRLPGFHYVLVSSTHNHEGPDTLGLWGASAFTSGTPSEPAISFSSTSSGTSRRLWISSNCYSAPCAAAGPW